MSPFKSKSGTPVSNARGAATPAKSRSEEPEGSAALEEDTFEGASEVTSVALVRQVGKSDNKPHTNQSTVENDLKPSMVDS